MNMTKAMMIVQFQPWLKEKKKSTVLYIILSFFLIRKYADILYSIILELLL